MSDTTLTVEVVPVTPEDSKSPPTTPKDDPVDEAREEKKKTKKKEIKKRVKETKEDQEEEEDQPKKKKQKEEKKRNKELNQAMEDIEKKTAPVYNKPEKKRTHHPAVHCVVINDHVWPTSYEPDARAIDGTIELKVEYTGPPINLSSKKRVEAAVCSSIRRKPVELLVNQVQ